MSTIALIVAAGRGTRARRGSDTNATEAGKRPPPKQYALIAGRRVLAHTLRIFLDHPRIDKVAAVIRAEDKPLYDDVVADLLGLDEAGLDEAGLEEAGLEEAGSGEGQQGQTTMEHVALAKAKLLPPIIGGDSRQASVRNGLDALAASDANSDSEPHKVLIHDAARPFVDQATVARVADALHHHQGAIAALPVVDTLKRAKGDGTIAGTQDREGLWRALTPQGFHFSALLRAHQAAEAQGMTSFTDDAAVAEWAGLDVALVEGNAANTKITTAQDLAAADRKFSLMANNGDNGNSDAGPLASGAAAQIMADLRVGSGFDVHRFTDGDHVWLCGVKIPHDKALKGHSDADVGLHALTDAILGAIGDGDIGAHFPPTDPQWKGAASDQFLADAARRVRALGGRISHADVTLLCEQPKIGPHREPMRARIAAILDIDLARVAVKATTTEGLGFTGRGEGIGAMATATILLPGAA